MRARPAAPATKSRCGSIPKQFIGSTRARSTGSWHEPPTHDHYRRCHPEQPRRSVMTLRGGMIATVAAAAAVVCGSGACGRNGDDAVTLWHAYGGDERAALEEVAARWNEAHPDKTLHLVAVPYDAFADKI